MTVKPSSWAKHLVAFAIVAYLLVLLVFIIIVSHDRLTPTPALEQAPVPPLPTITPDFAAISDISERKQAFFNFMRPFVAAENAYHRREREQLFAINAKFAADGPLSRQDQRKIAYWAERFHLPEELELQEQIDSLLRRINIIPEAMVLAQAAAESAWGRSRFAREANNYFGQWCYTAGCGLVPKRRSSNARHEVRRFDSAKDAVQAYFSNINTHRAYRSLRDKRLALEQAGEDITGLVLVAELGQYSQRGQPYVEELRELIRFNQLE